MIRRPDKHYECLCCGGARLKNLFLKDDFIITRCRDCSFVFVKDKVDLAYLDEVYRQTAGDYIYFGENRDCLEYYYTRLRDRIAALGFAPGRILDVGCSCGYFLDVMAGWERHGVEIVREAADLARARYGDAIHQGPFETYPDREGYFDVITLQDVLDHLMDPKEALARWRRMLRPGGLIVVKVHNISCLFAKLTGKRFYAIIPPTHLSYFNKRSAALALEATGFSVRKIESIAHLLRVKTIFYRLSMVAEKGLFFRIFQGLSQSRIGGWKIRKNLNDVITLFAVKRG